jgi:hypothetical protein
MKQLSSLSSSSFTGARWLARLTSLGCLGALALAAGCAPAAVEEDPSLASAHPLDGAGAIKDFTGLCLDVQWASTDNGAPIQLWSCNGTGAQQFAFKDGALVGLGGKCLDVKWGSTDNGAVVQLWDCNGTKAQQWAIEGQQLVGVGGKCLDVAGGNSHPGQTLEMWDCHGGENQRFSFSGSSEGAGSGGDPTPPSPPASGDLAAAQEFVRPLVLGVNVERGWAWSVPGGDSYWSYLKNTVGATHVRLFYPWRPSVVMGGGGANNAPPSEQQFGRILDASEQAIKAGLKVFLDCTDVMGTEDFSGSNGDETETEIRNCASWVAARGFDPTMIAVGPVNEWAGGDDNTTYNATRQHYQDVLRDALGGYVLTTGPGYWKSRDWLYDPSHKFQAFDDLRVIYEWHEYSTLDAAGWQSEEAKLAGWREKNGGRPTVCGEAGPGYWGDQVNGAALDYAPSAWPGLFGQMLPNIAAEAPSIWAVTYGGSYRINKSGDDAHVMDGSNGQPDLVKMFHDNAAAIRGAKGL